MSYGDLTFNLGKSGVYPNEELIAELASKTGYHFDGQRFNDRLYAAIQQAGDSFYDNVWRNELMPHIIKSLFREELENMHREIARQAQEKGISSEELLDDTLATGTDLMKQILEGYTTDLANQTELLGSPIRFTKESPSYTASAPENMTADEKKRWDNYVSDTKNISFLTTESELRSMRTRALKAYPLKSTTQVREDFQTRMTAPAPGNAPADINSEEAVRAILEIREIRNRYQKRGFFNRHLFHRSAAREELRTVREMTEALKRKYPAADVDRCINDPNYMAGKGGAVSAKQVYGLADVRPRSLRAQQIGDQLFAVGNKGAEIIGNVVTTVQYIGTFGVMAGRGFVVGAANGVKNAFNRWMGNGDVPKEEPKEERKEPGRERAPKEDRKESAPREQEQEKKQEKVEEKEPEIHNEFGNLFDEDDEEAIFGFADPKPEEIKAPAEELKGEAGDRKAPEDQKEQKDPEDQKEQKDNEDPKPEPDEDGDIFEDAQEVIEPVKKQENPPEKIVKELPEGYEEFEEAQEEFEEAPENLHVEQPDRGQDVSMDQADPAKQQGWGEWAWGGMKSAASYLTGGYFGGSGSQKNAQNGNDSVKDIKLEELQKKLGEPGGKPKVDYGKKRKEMEQEGPGLQAGNGNGAPVSGPPQT